MFSGVSGGVLKATVAVVRGVNTGACALAFVPECCVGAGLDFGFFF